MNALAVAQGYFDAWTHRDADGIMAAFTEHQGRCHTGKKR